MTSSRGFHSAYEYIPGFDGPASTTRRSILKSSKMYTVVASDTLNDTSKYNFTPHPKFLAVPQGCLLILALHLTFVVFYRADSSDA